MNIIDRLFQAINTTDDPRTKQFYKECLDKIVELEHNNWKLNTDLEQKNIQLIVARA